MDTEQSELKRTPEQEADLQENLRHQEGMQSTEGGPTTSATMRILGALSRFLGMSIMIGSAFLILINGADDAGPLILALVVGAGLHYAGRKLAPGAHWASATGGAVAGIGAIALILVPVVFVIILILGVLKFLGFG
jgi:hypothetical protein